MNILCTILDRKSQLILANFFPFIPILIFLWFRFFYLYMLSLKSRRNHNFHIFCLDLLKIKLNVWKLFIFVSFSLNLISMLKWHCFIISFFFISKCIFTSNQKPSNSGSQSNLNENLNDSPSQNINSPKIDVNLLYFVVLFCLTWLDTLALTLTLKLTLLKHSNI